MAKTVDLQPWLDYFEMLKVYEQKGLLQMEVEKHEAYVTQPALHAMSEGDDPTLQMKNGYVKNTVLRLRTYAAFLSTKGEEYMEQPFAVHVVKDEPPHDLIYTLLIERSRKLWNMWNVKDHIEVIEYESKKN